MTGKRHSAWRTSFALAILFALYQGSEGLQTVVAPDNPIGPALMIVALAAAWPIGRWLSWRGYDAYGLDLRARSFGYLLGGLLLAGVAKMASLFVGIGLGTYAFSPSGGDNLAGGALALGIATAALITFVPSITEDIITRGFLFRTLRPSGHFLAFAVFSAARARYWIM